MVAVGSYYAGAHIHSNLTEVTAEQAPRLIIAKKEYCYCPLKICRAQGA